MKEAIFNDYDYHLLSNDHSVTISDMKSFDQYDGYCAVATNLLVYRLLEAKPEDQQKHITPDN